MGAVSFSLDAKMIECLRQVLPLTVFVETGTFEGDTASRAVSYFDEIHTVELSDEYYQRACERLKHYPSVRVHRGQSAQCLRSLRPGLDQRSVLYWLDAHWCAADATAGMDSQCPLLEELDAIGTLNQNSVILIDDARLFLCPPPGVHQLSHWPGFHAILQKLLQLGQNHEIMVVNDVIALFPGKIRDTFQAFAREHAVDWLTAMDKSRDYDLLLAQLQEKEQLIHALDADAKNKETVIRNLDTLARERLRLIDELRGSRTPKAVRWQNHLLPWAS